MERCKHMRLPFACVTTVYHSLSKSFQICSPRLHCSNSNRKGGGKRLVLSMCTVWLVESAWVGVLTTHKSSADLQKLEMHTVLRRSLKLYLRNRNSDRKGRFKALSYVMVNYVTTVQKFFYFSFLESNKLLSAPRYT